MTAEEKIKFESMELGVQKIEKDVELIKLALLGNTLAGDEGLVGEIRKVKAKQENLETEVRLLRDERVKNSVYVKIITWLFCIIGIGVIGFVTDTALRKPKIQIVESGKQN